MKPDFQLNDHEIYMDNAATTAVAEEVLDAMKPYFEEKYGNPETVYQLGRDAKCAVSTARASISDIIKCQPEELFFTSGGTEANNWAIKMAGTSLPDQGVMVSSIEHASVLKSAKYRCRNVPYFEIPVDSYGVVDLVVMENELKTRKYALVSVQYANNEIGTIQPIAKISELCKEHGVYFHCDAVQAFGKVKFDVDDVGADLISLSSHKIHGPMGMGALYVKQGTILEPLLHGGGQEGGMRSGTLAVPEIVGFGKAAEMSIDSIKTDMPRLMKLSEDLANQICLSFKAKRNGHSTQRLPNIVNVTIPGMETSVVCGIMCSKFGTCLSAGAACSTAKRQSHVLEAIGHDAKDALSTLRFSLSRYNTAEEITMVFCRLQAAGNQAESRSLI